MLDYFDDIETLRLYVEDLYSNNISLDYLENLTLKQRRDLQSKRWGAFHILKICYDNPLSDPLDKMDSFLNDLNIEVAFSKQQINKDHFDSACEAIEDMILFLKKRRGL